MKTLRFSHSCTLTMDAPVGEHYFTLRIAPHDDPAQTVALDVCRVEPVAECSSQVDGWGNLLYVGSCTDPHSSFTYLVEGTATVDSTKGRGTVLNQGYLYPSPMTQSGPALKALCGEVPPCPGTTGPASFEHALTICHLVHEHMAYDTEATDVSTTAEQAASIARGVCQDYAHICIALLRADGIAARYVSGLMWGEGATHAWFEFYDGETWWGLDPTNDCEAGDYYIALARGRDHSDCPIENGVFRGIANQTQDVHVTVEVLD